MTTRAHLQGVTSWLADLANLSAGTAPLADAKAKIAASASLLAEEFPQSEVFSRESLTAVSAVCKFFPSYAELRGHLEAWWAVNKPSQLSAIASEDKSLDAEDRVWIKLWKEKQAEGFTDGPSPRDRLGLIRKYKPRAYTYLLRTDDQAAQIAVLNHWERDTTEKTPEDIEEVSATAQRIVAMLSEVGAQKRGRPLYARSGPQSVDEAREEVAKAAVKAYPLPKEQLDAVRAANPVVQKALDGEVIPPQPKDNGAVNPEAIRFMHSSAPKNWEEM